MMQEAWPTEYDPSADFVDARSLAVIDAMEVEVVPAAFSLPDRWNTLRYHEQQSALMRDRTLYITAFCGRRSGKTEVAGKRAALLRIFEEMKTDGRYIFAEPIRDQAKRIMWRDLKKMIPKEFVREYSETELRMEMAWGAEVRVMGMDAPQRAEGDPIDGVVLDEFANMRPEAWDSHILPGLETEGRSPGWAYLCGTPEGRNHAYELHQKGLDPGFPEWKAYHWPSSDILRPEVIERARRNLEPRIFRQEMEGSFEDFAGRVYYPFSRETHVQTLSYDPSRPLIFAFDFNVDPGTASVLQEQDYKGDRADVGGLFTAVLDEVWIRPDSNTPEVCRKLVEKWGHHKGVVICYGDPAGGSRGTAQTEGNDWQLIEAAMGKAFGKANVHLHIAKGDPGQRARINAVNCRLMAGETARMLVDPRCVHTIEDLEGVTYVEGKTEIDKNKSKLLTHLSDGIAYYCAEQWPIGRVLDLDPGLRVGAAW